MTVAVLWGTLLLLVKKNVKKIVIIKSNNDLKKITKILNTEVKR